MLTKIIFEPGDVAYLRSGSPPLTITALSEDGSIANVRWFEDETSFKDTIPIAALVSAQQVEHDRERENVRKSRRVQPRKSRCNH